MKTIAGYPLICVILAGFQLIGLIFSAETNAQGNGSGTAFLTAPRPLRQHLSRAKDAIEDKRFGDAVADLGVLLAEEETGDALVEELEQDYFLDAGRGRVARDSLKREAQQILGTLPKSALELYELQFGADARELLNDAAASGNLRQLTAVTRKYFHTKAGYEATLLLGRLQLDRGQPMAAAMSLQRLLNTRSAANAFEPELSLLSAACWARANRADRARETLEQLRLKSPDFIKQLPAGESVSATPESQIETWLTKQSTRSNGHLNGPNSNWLVFRGNAARNASTSGDVPLPSYRWRIPTASDSTDENLIEEIRADKVEQQVAAIPSVHPLAVKDVVLMRTPKRLLAVNFETGKRVWEYPWWSVSSDDVPLTTQSNTAGGELAARRERLFQRLWQDSPYGQVSSDGESVFMLDELRYTSTVTYSPRNGGLRFRSPDAPEDFNQLVALDLRRQGALRWMVGGETGLDEPKLAGAFFLGPPLPISGHLYAIAELKSEIRLVVLDATNGQMQWSQQLTHVDSSPVSENVPRRLAGAMPSYADGVLVCPTSAGAIIAVDIATRSLIWGYQYSQPRPNNVFGFNRGFVNRRELPDRPWLDASVTISDGLALVAPIDSKQIICLDLSMQNNEAKWSIARDGNSNDATKPDLSDSLFVGCIHDGQALIVCKDQLVAINMQNGKATWESPIEFRRHDSEMPSGHGFLSGDYYYLPMSSSTLLKVSLKDGQIEQRVPTPGPLGNLVCYKDEIISHSAGSVATYFQMTSLRRRVAERLTKNSNDPWALARQGELHLHDGSTDKALAALQKAHELDPEDDTVRALLVSTFLAAVKDNFAEHRNLADQVLPLIDTPAQLAEYWQSVAQGHHDSGELAKAVEAYLALTEIATSKNLGAPSTDPILVAQDSSWSVRSDRWIQARLAQLYETDDESVRQRLGDHITKLIGSRDERTIAELQDDLNYFGFHPETNSIRIALADKLISAGRLVEAEVLLSPLTNSSEATVAASAIARTANVYTNAKEWKLVITAFNKLGNEFASIVCQDGKTGATLLVEAKTNPLLKDHFGSHSNWPWGAAEVEEKSVQSRSEALLRLMTIPVHPEPGQSTGGKKFGFDPRFNAVVARDAGGHKVMEISIDTVNQNGLDQAHLLGKLGIIYFGSELIGVDMLSNTLARNESVRWRLTVTSRTTNLGRETDSRPPFDPLPAPIATNLDDTGHPVSSLGPVTRSGIVYQRNRTINCVEPLTGKLAWSRGGIAAGAIVSGDDELVIVTPPNDEPASVYRMTDGKFLGERVMPATANRWKLAGRFVLAWESHSERTRFYLRDVWEQRDVWSEDVSSEAKATVSPDGLIALLDINGRFVVHSLTSSNVLIRTVLEADEDLQSLRLVPSGDDYILFANTSRSVVGTNAPTIRHAHSHNAPVASGRMYLIDRATGKLRWQVPAFIDEHGFVLQQPSNSPALWFVRNVSNSQALLSPEPTKQASVMCIDRRDGRIVFAKEDLATQVNEFSVASNSTGDESTIWLPGRSITVKFTDTPIPPSPPAQTGAASSLNLTGSTLANMAGTFIDSLKQQSKAEAQEGPFDDKDDE